MSTVRIRKPFAASFVLLLLAAAYLGLSTQKIPQYGQSDKGLHFITFFLLTLTFYWILETSRKRMLHLTLLVCTAGLSIGSEIVQALLPNGRDFDPFDILANVVGSAIALLLSNVYHKRMLERRRKSKHYDIVPGEEPGDDEERDVELGEGVGQRSGEQETGSVPIEADGQTEAGAQAKPSVTEELDNWDENADDWDEEPVVNSETPANSLEGDGDTKKRAD
ncbi:hypothetical protein LTR36_007665 [Oleoguttula mirabilis]|uniref:VanZ-like domain-containing protein n=1 Tax=Oleoguttula mirabilis TaxID=1507867 RepID=A0AAV9JU91_9PEZI|nr:hypothetical protein LTR36_007665 [Oleoguttula mirabilis]